MTWWLAFFLRVWPSVVVVAFSSHARIWGECSTIHSPPALYFIYLFIYLFHFGRMFDHLFPVCALFYLFIYFILGECLTIHFQPPLCFILFIHFIYFEVEIRSRPLILLFMPGSVHSGSASCDDCCRMFPDKLRVSSFPDRFPTLCLDSDIAHSDFDLPQWGAADAEIKSPICW